LLPAWHHILHRISNAADSSPKIFRFSAPYWTFRELATRKYPIRYTRKIDFCSASLCKTAIKQRFVWLWEWIHI